jgi:hypothetical protein
VAISASSLPPNLDWVPIAIRPKRSTHFVTFVKMKNKKIKTFSLFLLERWNADGD